MDFTNQNLLIFKPLLFTFLHIFGTLICGGCRISCALTRMITPIKRHITKSQTFCRHSCSLSSTAVMSPSVLLYKWTKW